ncbi:MAG TPA: outer membrane protein assembly factor BamD [Candidatus Acidoferrales bacterium]|nr:outer membrane protein assembly factor BamD [Candidatus Acidoferrales bacterium]
MRVAKTLGIAAMVGSLFLGGCLGKKKTTTAATQTGPAANDSVAPDKVLYERSEQDLSKGHYEVARLSLQALINTYPDSEYLAKAKLAIADSYYKEGGTSGMTQAVNEYKDFITFFPFLDEAAYAQMQVGMAHYKRVEKPDRDRSEAESAEQEFQIFLQKYPQSPLVPQVQQQLRNVQEILADGDFRIAQYYNTKGSYRAAAGRLLDVVARYPLYSKSDQASFMLANIYQRNEKTQFAGAFYAKIVRDYPLSPLAPQAKQQLQKLGVPVPQADPVALARMQQEQQMPHPREGLFHRVEGPLEGKPDMSAAARVGQPQMAPPDESSEMETLVRTANLSVSGGVATGGSGGSSAGSTGTTAGSETSTSTGESSGTATSTPPNAAAVQLITPGTQPTPGPAATISPAPGAPPATLPAAPPATGTAPPESNSTGTSATPATTADPNATQSQPCTPTTANSATSSSQQGSSTDGKTPPPPCKQDTSKESSSKKKKGIKKIIPWG